MMDVTIMKSSMRGISLIRSPSSVDTCPAPKKTYISAVRRSKTPWKSMPTKSDETKTLPVALPFKSVNRTAASMMERLEKKARTSAAVAAERVLHEDAPCADVALLKEQQGRMNGWWADHLVTLSSMTETMVNRQEVVEEADVQVTQGRPSRYTGMGSREADADRRRACIREFYYPRSNPSSYF